jgi:hypothetical protein
MIKKDLIKERNYIHKNMSLTVGALKYSLLEAEHLLINFDNKLLEKRKRSKKEICASSQEPKK